MKVAEIVLSGSVVGTAEVEERKDLYGFTLERSKNRNIRQVLMGKNTQPLREDKTSTASLDPSAFTHPKP